MSPLTFVAKTSGTFSIKSYFLKKVLTSEKFVKAVQKIPLAENPHIHNGKTIWSDDNLRLDWGENKPGANEFHFNLQKNKTAKLDGLSKVNTHEKLISLKVEKGADVSAPEIEQGFKVPMGS